MKNTNIKIGLVIFLFFFIKTISNGQNHKVFEMAYPKTTTLNISEEFSKSKNIFPFKQKDTIFSFGIKAQFQLNGYKSFLRIILVTENGEEYLVLESNYMLNSTDIISISDYGEETTLLNGVIAGYLKVEMENASLFLQSISLNNRAINNKSDADFTKAWRSNKNRQDSIKIARITEHNKINGYSWIAGQTSISPLTFSQKKKVFGDPLPNLRGFEYYVSGIFNLTAPRQN